MSQTCVIQSLLCEKYKAFKHRQRVALGKLTLLVGKNSSGKSALARLPLLLGQAFRQTAVPVDLDALRDTVDLGAGFVDLVHGRSAHGAVQLGGVFQLATATAPIEVLATVQNFRESMLQIVTRWQIGWAEATKPWLILEWSGTEPEQRELRPYHGELWMGETRTEVPEQEIAFGGILPDNQFARNLQQTRGFEVDLVRTLESLSELHKGLTYLGPFRPTPERSYRMPSSLLRHVGSGGGKAASLLAADSVRNQSRVVQAAADWYEQHLGGWRLDVQREGGQFSLVLRSKTDRSIEINLVDTGAGMSQVLPIVVQRCLDAAGAGSAGLEIIEQPELHLHPAAHGPLADLFVEVVRSHPNRQFLIETHSENFLLRLRRRIAEGTLSPQEVRMYWVDDRGTGSQVLPIEIHENGDVSNWPQGVFSEDFEELRLIRRAQRSRPTTSGSRGGLP